MASSSRAGVTGYHDITPRMVAQRLRQREDCAEGELQQAFSLPTTSNPIQANPGVAAEHDNADWTDTGDRVPQCAGSSLPTASGPWQN
jgi:hypothetical protein